MPETLETIAATLTDLRKSIDAQFKNVDAHFTSVDAQFKNVDAHFTSVDAQFKNVDAHFTSVDARFKNVDVQFKNVDAQFTSVDAHFTSVDAHFTSVDAHFTSVDAQFKEIDEKIDQQTEDLKAHLGMKIEALHETVKLVYDAVISHQAHFGANEMAHETFTKRLDNHDIRILAIELPKPPS
jgi:peptidoglycan hydrolase CwlO-like protein